ncbi:hypothetical protein ACFFIX_23455 [Metabacillus herbersteinensis]|uniref:YodL-like protein n=1 Tax=Metabacillus herbersteinensis TaxID=283816 RepID=A0ABV6GKU1_9BACI
MVSYLFLLNKRISPYDITIFQTPAFGESKGYRPVYRVNVEAPNHPDAIKKVFRMFNVPDMVPSDYHARFISTGDILLIDEGRRGQTYYRLHPEGWTEINRIHVR